MEGKYRCCGVPALGDCTELVLFREVHAGSVNQSVPLCYSDHPPIMYVGFNLH